MENNKRTLISQEIISDAVRGDEYALSEVLQHYKRYIAKVSINPITGLIDRDLQCDLTTQLVLAVLKFKIR